MAILRIKNAEGSWVDVPEIHGENAYEGAVRNGYTGTEQEFYEQLSNFTTYADEAEAAATLAQEVKESIPQDYTDLSNHVDNITDHIIEITDTQPVSEENKLWIQDDEQVQEVQVPTYEEFEELRDSVAPIEENSTFSKGYSKGEYFIHDGGLCETTDNVAQGDTITVGTNCITVPGGVVGKLVTTDPTLTISGKAADAKATGDQLSALKSALSLLQNSIFDDSESTGVIVYIPDIVAGTTLVNIESASLGSDEVIYATGRNMYTDGDVSGTQSKDVTFSNPLPAGTYTISLIANSTDTDSDKCALQLTDIDNGAVTTLQFARGIRKSFTFTAAKTIVKATFFASKSWSKGAGDTFGFTDIQIEVGSNVSDYHPAVTLQTATKQTSTKVIALSDNMTVYNLANAQMTVHYKKSADGTKVINNLYGKRVYWDGDSIMYGYGYTGGFANLIAQRNAMESTNFAVSGATLAQTSASHCIASSIAQMSNDADYYIFDGGVNDVEETANRGTISNGYDSTLDTTTMIGAFEYICKSLVNKPGKKYGYIFVQRIFNASDEWETALKPMMEQVLNKWGIPYIDLEKEIPPLGFIPSLANAYMADGGKWHPNEDGYKKYFVEKIEAWMQTL